MDWMQSFFMLRLRYHWQRLKSCLPRRDRASARADELRAGFYARLWREAADRLGAICEPLAHGIFQISLGSKRTRVQDSCTALDDPVTLAVAANKALTYRLLVRDGLPVPRHREFNLRHTSDAIAFLEEVGGDCVVKPASGTGAGQGVTTGVRTRKQLGSAAVLAAQLGSDLLIEEQVPGKNYRLLYLDAILLDAVERRPPTVTGDGQTTVRRLIEQANRNRLARGDRNSQVLVTIDPDMLHTLGRQGKTLRSVPEQGESVELKTVINQNFGQDNVSVMGDVCPAVIEIGARASRAVGVRLAGVDVIAPDMRRPLTESGGVVLEVNATPGLHHHSESPGGAVPIAARILETLLICPPTPGTQAASVGENLVEADV